MGLMRNLLLSVVLAAGLILPIGVAQAQSTATVTATCRTARPLPGRSGPAPVAATGACSHGARRPARPMHHRSRRSSLRLQQASGPRPVLPAPVRCGSTPPARSTTAPALAGTARPSRAATCPSRKRGHRAPGRTTERLAPRRAYRSDAMQRSGWADRLGRPVDDDR
jgi:hypothetical protein